MNFVLIFLQFSLFFFFVSRKLFSLLPGLAKKWSVVGKDKKSFRIKALQGTKRQALNLAEKEVFFKCYQDVG